MIHCVLLCLSGLNEEESENATPDSQKDRINKYRNLLRGIEEKEKQDGDKDMEMEISWEPGNFFFFNYKEKTVVERKCL